MITDNDQSHTARLRADIKNKDFILYLRIPKKWAQLTVLVFVIKYLPDLWKTLEVAIPIIGK